jgi:hypothetical protein
MCDMVQLAALAVANTKEAALAAIAIGSLGALRWWLGLGGLGCAAASLSGARLCAVRPHCLLAAVGCDQQCPRYCC